MFVVIEGIDGTGKSTLARDLGRALAKDVGDDHVLVTREPTTDSPWGKRLREAASKGRLSRTKEIEYFHKDRLHHLDTVIKPALTAGKIVICDRYVDSFLAYQTASPAAADELYTRLGPELLEPDLVLLLILPVETALKRIGSSRSGRSQFELAETLERASAIYASRSGKRYQRLDASGPPEAVLEAALQEIRVRLS